MGGSTNSQGSRITAVEEKGPHNKSDELRAACTANLTNAETYRNPVGWSEIRIGLRSLHGAKLARASFFFFLI